MNVAEVLRWAMLELGNLPSARTEAEILLSAALGWSRSDLYSNGSETLDDEALGRFRSMVARRARHEPLQYITGFQMFRHIEVEVGPGVLVPRPETEVVVGRALELLAGVFEPKVVEIGTGSGAVAISIATERPDSRVWATEISREALVWARRNEARHSRPNLALLEGDYFSPLPLQIRGSVALVISNPPYLSESEVLAASPDVRDHEPRIATVSGASGEEHSLTISREGFDWLITGGYLVLETSPTIADRLKNALSERYCDVKIGRDLGGLQRVAEARRP